MDYTELNGLLEMSKKTEASKAKKRRYVELVVSSLEEEGITDNTISVLKNGFSFAGAKPLAIYIQKAASEVQEEEIKKIFSSELVRGNDRLAVLRLCVNMSAYSIEWFGNNQKMLIEAMKIIPRVSKNKEGQLLKDAPKIFEKYFLDVISEKTELPDFAALDIKEIYIREFLQTLMEIIENSPESCKKKSKKIVDWIALFNFKKGKGEDISLRDIGAIQESTSNDKPQIQEDTGKKPLPLRTKDIYTISSILTDISSRIALTVEASESIQKELDSARTQNKILKESVNKADIQRQKDIGQIEHLSLEIEHYLAQIAELQAKQCETRAKMESIIEELASVKGENARLGAIISVYSSDKQNTQTEQLNAIASKLKSEYHDFKDVENEEMSIDLGENFRFQLQSIFKILAKAGIDVERR